jgi:two-component system KDP operon response regulator KdpE
MKKPLIFILDDENSIGQLLCRYFESYGYKIRFFDACQTLLEVIRFTSPNLILLGFSLGTSPDSSLFCREIRNQSQIPIIILGIQDDRESKLSVLNAGADEFIKKPFDMDELETRIHMVLKRRLTKLKSEQNKRILVSGLKIDLLQRKVYLNNHSIHLTDREYELLLLLAQESGRIVTVEQIIQVLYHQDHSKRRERNCRVILGSLRRKLLDDFNQPRYIFNEPGLGYRFVDSPEDD